MYKHETLFTESLLFILHRSTGNQKGNNVYCGQICRFQKHVPPTFCQLYDSVYANQSTFNPQPLRLKCHSIMICFEKKIPLVGLWRLCLTKVWNGITALVGSVQYTCLVVPLCIVDASLSHYVGN